MQKRVLILAIGLFIGLAAQAQTNQEIKVNDYFNTIKSDKKKLKRFIRNMPKGGDLHNHLSGAIYAEKLLHYAKNDNFCINRQNFIVFENAECEANNFLNMAIKNYKFYNALINSWSMRNFIAQTETGHKHFFSAFAKYNVIVKKHLGEVLAEVAHQAAINNGSYLELMVTLDGNQSSQLGKQLGWDDNFDLMRARLLAKDFDKITALGIKLLNGMEATKNELLGCGSSASRSGCKIKIRYLAQVSREQIPEMIFAQMLASFEIASKDMRVVGINLVQPEDGMHSMQHYQLHMRMLQYFHKVYPEVAVSLHAGELNDTLVPAEGLTFHIKEAVEIAQAQRIGHGVDLIYENNYQQLLETMAKKNVLVEINLSSNNYILNSSGTNHPLPLYIQAGVPVALSTDDQGINRSNLSGEYELAVRTYNFDYLTLKTFARNSLTYSFMPGKSLWMDNTYQLLTADCRQDAPGKIGISKSCQQFIANNEKAALQWQLENNFEVFESQI